MRKFGLIGYPLGHSFSKNFFNEKFHSENIDAEYVNFEIPSIEELPYRRSICRCAVHRHKNRLFFYRNI